MAMVVIFADAERQAPGRRRPLAAVGSQAGVLGLVGRGGGFLGEAGPEANASLRLPRVQ